jgi:hypothetical protein
VYLQLRTKLANLAWLVSSAYCNTQGVGNSGAGYRAETLLPILPHKAAISSVLKQETMQSHRFGCACKGNWGSSNRLIST